MHAHKSGKKPIEIDDWVFHHGRLFGRLRTTGEKIITSRITDLDMALGWVETETGSLYYLGRRAQREHRRKRGG